MSDTQELKQALITMDVDTVMAITGLSFQAATDKCEKAAGLQEAIMSSIRNNQDPSIFQEQLSDLTETLLSKSKHK